MISDERLAKIGELIARNLNEDGAPSKVILHITFTRLTKFKGGIGAVNARVYAVKVRHQKHSICSLILDFRPTATGS
jgi:hypothetical protein